MSTTAAAAPELRATRGAELALAGIAAVWGLAFVMVQDAIAVLPTVAFLAYRFGSAALIVAVVFGAGCARSASRRTGRRAGPLPHCRLRVPDPGGLSTRAHRTRASSPASRWCSPPPAFAGLFGSCRRASGWAWSRGWVLILAAIVAVELVPRLRPPRPLPEGVGRRLAQAPFVRGRGS